MVTRRPTSYRQEEDPGLWSFHRRGPLPLCGEPARCGPVRDGRALVTLPTHVEVLLDALRVQGVPRPGSSPAEDRVAFGAGGGGALAGRGHRRPAARRRARFAVSLGPQFGAITMAQVSDALRAAIGFDLVVFAGFAVSADAQDKLGDRQDRRYGRGALAGQPRPSRWGSAQEHHLEPDVPPLCLTRRHRSPEATTATGSRSSALDSFDAATGATTSFGKTGIQAWFLDDDYDGTVFRVAQAFFPVTDAWDKLQRGTADHGRRCPALRTPRVDFAAL